MAIGGYVGGNPNRDGELVHPVSVKGSWVIANDDAEQVNSAAELLSPGTIDDSTFHWVRVGPGCGRVLVRARVTLAATVTTDPVVRIVGAYGNLDSGNSSSFPTDGTVQFMRLDNVDANAAGLTLDLVSSASGQMQDATYAYSDPMPSLDGIDLKGADYVGVLIETAANVNTGVVAVQILMLN